VESDENQMVAFTGLHKERIQKAIESMLFRLDISGVKYHECSKLSGIGPILE
jgi:hypothetical protein